MSPEIYENLPEDPEMAFIYLEKHFRDELTMQLNSMPMEGASYSPLYLEYINRVTTAAVALDVKEFGFYGSVKEVDAYDYYEDLKKQMDSFIIRTSIRNGRQTKKYSVLIDRNTKEQIRDNLAKIKTLITNTDIPSNKREALFDRIGAFESELERDRTRYEVVMDFMLQTTDTLGKSADNLSPLQKLVDRINNLISSAKSNEKEKSMLPKPIEQKRLEPPRAEHSNNTSEAFSAQDEDDTIV